MEHFNLAPTWAALIPVLVEVAANGDTTQARNQAMGELLRIATTVDEMNAEKTAEAQEEDHSLPEGAEIELTTLGTQDDGIDGSDKWILVVRKDDDITPEQARQYIQNLYYRECSHPGGYFCTTVEAVQREYRKNEVICTVHHRYDN